MLSSGNLIGDLFALPGKIQPRASLKMSESNGQKTTIATNPKSPKTKKRKQLCGMRIFFYSQK